MRITALALASAISISILGASSPVAHAATTPAAPKNNTNVTVTIEPGDTLTAIATDKQSTVERIYSANTKIENPDLIYPGDSIRVPSADEQLTMRELPATYVPPAPTVSAPSSPAVTYTPAPKPAPSTAPAVAGSSVWDQLALCEAGGNWAINTGNGFYGGLQFTLSSWQGVGGSGYPNQASREEQIMRGQMLQARQGWGAWPACASKLGLL